MNYYMRHDGTFSGQYICVRLEDIANKNLHRRIGRSHFKMQFHRTEVVKHPAGRENEPVFPLTNKYYHCNYSLEDIENKKDEICDVPVRETPESERPELPADFMEKI